MQQQKARKSFYRQRKQAKSISRQAEASIDRLLFGRFDHLLRVKRFVSGWIILWLLLALITGVQLTSLANYYQTLKPVPGGIYSEGLLGQLTNVNPIYATSPVDQSLSKLIFAGLFTYNDQNQLVGCLASGYSVDASGTVYTVKLKPNLTWQDGKPLTAADVVFTYQTIQNAEAQSPLFSGWQNITIVALNPQTVTFTLPNPLASFPYNLTVGIIPQHILGSLPPADLREAGFNTDKPVGAGPFAWHELQVSGNTPQNASEQIALVPFSGYVFGKPKLNEFIVNAYADRDQLIGAFRSGQLTALAGMDAVPSELRHDPAVQIQSRLLSAGDYVFFRTDNGVLSDVSVRRAMVLAANPSAIIARLGYQTLPVTEPLLIGQLGYNRQYAEVTNQPNQAMQLLSKDGWTATKSGTLSKSGQELAFNVVATDTPENRLVGGMLKRQWAKVGADVQLIFESPDTYTTTLETHNYDSTLNGISIGNDPDVFVYWDKTQYDPRSSNLNFSDWNNAAASEALEAGRTRLDPALRVIKYQPLLSSWQSDAPALGLFQPRFLYITKQNVYGMSSHMMNTAVDRFDDVQNWEILTAGVTD